MPTLDIMAAVDLPHQLLPALRVHVVNLVDRMTMQPKAQQPHGRSEENFDALFTIDRSMDWPTRSIVCLVFCP